MLLSNSKGVSKTYGGTTILDNISFNIYSEDRIGVVGRNGSGKTTLFRLIADFEKPNKGSIHNKKDLLIGFLAQMPSFEQSSILVVDVLKQAFKKQMDIKIKIKLIEQKMSKETNSEKLSYLVKEHGILLDKYKLEDGYLIDSKIDNISYGMGFHDLLFLKFESLSGGEKMKVCLGFMLLTEPNLLLLDEPTNHLDVNAVDWLISYLNNFKGTVLIISHDRYVLDKICNKIFNIEDKQLTIYHANYTSFLEEKEKRLLKEFEQFKVQQKKLKKMRETIKTLKDWANRANPPNANMHRRARSMEKALEKIEKLNRPNLDREKISLSLESNTRSGKDVLIMKNVFKEFPNKKILDEGNLYLKYQERVVICGGNGTGKSTILKMILGYTQLTSGYVQLGTNIRIGYIPQEINTHFSKNETIIEALRKEVSLSIEELRNILAKFLFFGDSVFNTIGSLSGGELMRLKLVELMIKDVNMLILDEPTNHLDTESREVLEDALIKYKGTILAVSHDRYFINKMFNKIYWLKNRKLTFYEGKYDEIKNEINKLDEKYLFSKKKKKQKIQLINTKKSKNTYTKEKIEMEIESIEVILSKIEDKMNSTNDMDELQELFKEKESIDNRREALYDILNKY